MLDCLTRIKDIRPLIDRRYKDGEWRFHRNSAYKQWKRILRPMLATKKPGCKTGLIRYFKSGREDLNLRPPAPKAGALARLRYAPYSVRTLYPIGRWFAAAPSWPQ